MDEVDQRGNRVDRRLREDAVAEVEDMPRPTAGAVQDVLGFAPHHSYRYLTP